MRPSTLFCLGKEEDGENDTQLWQGEGGETGELVPGKSLVFAAMELLVFLLVRHIPQLNTRVKESPSHLPLRPQRLPEESARLVANTVSILAELPSLCSPAGEAWGTKYTMDCLVVLLLYPSPPWPVVFKFLFSNGIIGFVSTINPTSDSVLWKISLHFLVPALQGAWPSCPRCSFLSRVCWGKRLWRLPTIPCLCQFPLPFKASRPSSHPRWLRWRTCTHNGLALWGAA